MLTQEVLLQLQKYNFDLLARQEPSGRRRLRYLALAHIKDGKSASETALALRVTPRAVSQWLKWFVDEGLDRVAGIPPLLESTATSQDAGRSLSPGRRAVAGQAWWWPCTWRGYPPVAERAVWCGLYPQWRLRVAQAARYGLDISPVGEPERQSSQAGGI